MSCPVPDRSIGVRVWKARRRPRHGAAARYRRARELAEDRQITGELYGGERELRLQQEAVLGIGGVRALRALGLEPTVWHINEGHAAFSMLERLREYTTGGLPFAAALEATAADTVFTTHTPVSAGHDVFPPDRVARAVRELSRGARHLARAAARARPRAGTARRVQHDAARVARLGGRVNGVSKIHGGVSSRLCARPIGPTCRRPRTPSVS